jgi:hypothetical protein
MDEDTAPGLREMINNKLAEAILRPDETAEETGHYSTAGGNDPFETNAAALPADCQWDNCFKPGAEGVSGEVFCAHHAQAMREIEEAAGKRREARKSKAPAAPEYDPTQDHQPCAACNVPFSLHNPPGPTGACPPPPLPQDAQQEKTLDTSAPAGVSSGMPPGYAPMTAAPGAGTPALGIREAMEGAARASWAWMALEQMEWLRVNLPQDAPQPILDHFKLLAEAIAGDITGISPDVLNVPEMLPPPVIQTKRGSVENTRAMRPEWKAEALHALQSVMDATDIDASNAVYNEWGLLKDEISKATNVR